MLLAAAVSHFASTSPRPPIIGRIENQPKSNTESPSEQVAGDQSAYYVIKDAPRYRKHRRSHGVGTADVGADEQQVPSHE